jgi:protocatechuate 3,4-dioxygenase beta subunit
VYAWAEKPVSFAMTTTSAAANAPRIEMSLTRFPRVLLRLLDDDGKPVHPEQVITYVDANGQYGAPIDDEGWADVAAELGGLAPGRRRITVLASGFVPAFLTVETKPGVDTRTELKLHRGVGVSGRVTRPDGSAFSQAILELEPECNAAEVGGNEYDLRQLAFHGFTDEDGKFQVDGLMPVPYRLQVRGFEGNAAVVIHLTPPAKDLALMVHDESQVKFALKLPAGDPRPATPVFVALRRSSPDAKIADVTERPWDKADAMSCDLPEPGAWVVDIHVPGYSLVERSVDVKPGEDAELGVLPLDRGLTLEGRVTAPDGSPIASALVRLPDDRIEKRGRWDTDHPRVTDADGRFRATGVAPGAVEIWVWAQGYAVHRMRVDMKPECAPVQVPLVPGTIVRGVARFGGVGVSDAEIRVSAPDRPGDPDRTGTLGTEGDGGFVLALPAGHYVVEASHPRIGAGRAEFDVGTESAPRVEVVLERRK